MTRWLTILVLVLCSAIAAPSPALAQGDLPSAKAAGLIGERPDGLVGAVSPAAPANIRALVEQINAQRLARYREIATRNGTALDQVQAVAGAQLVDMTPAGQYVLNAAGQWVRK